MATRWKVGPPPRVEGVYLIQFRNDNYNVAAATIMRNSDDSLVMRWLGFAYRYEREDSLPKDIYRHIGPFKFPATGKPRRKKKV